jgi:hypothetical protein
MVMTMRKAVLLAGLALALGAGTASATEGRNIGKLSVGYQNMELNTGSTGLFSGGASGLSSRYWINNEVGVEGNIYVLSQTEKSIGYESKQSVLAGTVKGMFSPVVKENSRFYVGLEAGLGEVNFKETGYTEHTNSFWLVRPLVGAEYNFAGIPELGVNFEVGYIFTSYNEDDTYYADPSTWDMSGLSLGAGVHYYF